MSIASETRKAGPYTGNGITTALPFSFKVFSEADVLVVRADLSGVETTLTLTTHYTVSLNADQDSNPGGTVNLVTAAESGHLTTITSQVANLQPVVLTNAGGFYPSVINSALDRLTILTQQLAEKVGRAVKVNISSSASPDDLIGDLQSAAADAESAAVAASASAELAATSAGSIPSMTGGADTVLVINPTNDGWMYKTAAQMRTFLDLVVGINVLAPNGDGSSLTGISTVQAGAIVVFARNTAPTGYMKANGAAVSRSTYSNLFTAIGTTFGVGDGSTTFNIPDLRGEFIRGWDDSRGIDSGRAFGSAQADELKSHVHSVSALLGTSGGAPQSSGSSSLNPYNTNATGGAETRPRNIALLACIKY